MNRSPPVTVIRWRSFTASDAVRMNLYQAWQLQIVLETATKPKYTDLSFAP
jgi:hypothetical protein